MKSFFKTPERKQRQILMAGDLAVTAFALALTFLLQIIVLDRIEAFTGPVARLPLLPKIIAITNLCIMFTGVVLLFGLVYLSVFHVIGLYEIEVVFDRKRSVTKSLGGVGIGILLMAAILNLLSRSIFTPQLWAFHAATMFTLLFFWRFFFFNRISSADPYEVLVIGNDPLSCKAMEHLNANGSRRFFRFHVVNKEEFFKNLHGPLAKNGRYHMIVYPFLERPTNDELIMLLKKKFDGVRICNSLTFYKTGTDSYPVLDLNAQWLIDLSVSLSLKGNVHQRVKRVVDIVVSSTAVFFALPLFVLIALLVKLTSRGPVFYLQERLGMNEKPFMLYKFRSMITDAENDSGPVAAIKNDPRVTTVGKFLRKTHFDELPQLANVLKGDMSIVGPRPTRPFTANTLAKELPFYFLRFYVKPGLTGWDQVNGDSRDSMKGLQKKLEYELFYINEYSLLLDVEILLKTFKKVFMAAGQ